MDIEVMEFVEGGSREGVSISGGWSGMKFSRKLSPPLVAEFGLRFCFVFLFVAALSFLGLGIQPPIADWGGNGQGERRSHQLRHLFTTLAGGGHRPALPSG